MYIKPNVNEVFVQTKHKNDLYRKFKDYFIGATEKEFNQFDCYGKDGYISVDPAIEERIFDTLSHHIDELVPITGSTGIGKTYLLLYCLKCYYNVNHIATNHPQLYPNENGTKDLVYYSDFNITEPSLLKNPEKLILAKIKAINECLMANFDIEEPDIDHYITNNKLEVKFYPEEKTIYQRELYKLTNLLNEEKVAVENVVFIFDDLESLDENRQFDLVKHYLTLLGNLTTKSNGKYCSKFLFCLRSSTFYNIYKRDFYNTHRASRASCLTVAPSLSQVFSKRFEIILKSEKVSKAKNLATWKEAKKVLESICNRVDNSYSDLLVKLNNNNISNALDDFLSILSNRRWTQKNVNLSASFKIEANNYYINDSNILRILSMGEQEVYFQTNLTPIRCILPEPGVNDQNDLISFLVLRAFQFNSYTAMGNLVARNKQLSVDEVVEQITDCLFSNDESNYFRKERQIRKVVENAFTYYEENRFIRKNVDPEAISERTTYFMLPRGMQIFNLFFSQSILFSIFRDAFFWDDTKYDTRCSTYLTFDELLDEAIKYDQQLVDLEQELFKKICDNHMMRSYISFFGYWSASESFWTGIKKSVQQFYKNESAPEEVLKKMNVLWGEIEKLTNQFKIENQENRLF